jgi:glycosyltransferase involved in cell wall biosynthesis
MTLTVNIMSYKYGHLAAHSIESVLNQRRRPDVIRFFDDGVGDCKHLPEIYPEVEFVLRPKNLGVIDNFNDALSRVTTERVLYLGADNWLDPETIELCMQRDEDIISYDAYKVTSDGYYDYWHLQNFPHGSAMYNVEKGKEIGYGTVQPEGEHVEEDNYLFTRMLNNGASLHIIEKPLLLYRWRHRLNYNQ